MTQTACWLRYTKMTIPILKHYEPMGALCNVTQRFSLAAGWCTGTCHICAGDWAHPMPHLHRDWAHPCAHLHRDWVTAVYLQSRSWEPTHFGPPARSPGADVACNVVLLLQVDASSPDIDTVDRAIRRYFP